MIAQIPQEVIADPHVKSKYAEGGKGMNLVTRAKHLLFPFTSGFEGVALHQLVDPSRALQLRLPPWDSDPGAGTFWDLTTIAAITASTAPKVCFEIGTGLGRSTLTMALNSPADAVVHTLDICESAGTAFRSSPEGRKIRQLVGDSRSFQCSGLEGRVDLVLVDGGHDYDAVLSDTKVAFRLAAPDGVILWHDVNPDWPGVVAALKESKKQRAIRRLVGTAFAYAGPLGRQSS